ncbi:MAG: UDP-N-acetylmuramoyl-L-alanyl-D-glutamate--2,6-diaminopimelate ligase [Eubacteriaceae bacterium]|nr:UDP-N-acetylmuramoyl-L-alanyl-D-glutamate--2,6-diaminopimelate ligase [Eubacteriaceae bacterium]
MQLIEIIKTYDYKLLKGSTEMEIQKLCYDSRKCVDQSIFFAIKGYQMDGNQYIESAVRKGAGVIVTETDPDEYINGITYLKVKDVRKALSRMSAEFHGQPSKKIKVIGITGTNGKTSTAFFLKNILECAGRKTGIIGTLGNFYDDKEIKTEHTTPESLEINEVLDEMVKNHMEYVVMEVSSHGLDLKRVDDISFHGGIFTNLTQDHLDFHGTMENYYNAKEKLFYMTTEYNIINVDDKWGKDLYKKLEQSHSTGNKPANISFGTLEDSDLRISEVHNSSEGVSFYLSDKNFHGKVSSVISGDFTVYNLAAAAAAALREGITMSEISEMSEDIQGVPGRIEKVKTEEPFQVIIDFAHTPDGLANILNTLRKTCKGRIITVFGCGGNRDRSKRSIMGEIAGSLSDYCIVTSDNPRFEEPMDIINEILPGVVKSGGKYEVVCDRYKAIQRGLMEAKAGDTLLIAGKGHEAYQIIKDKKIDFNEKKIIKEILSRNESNKN